MSQSLSGTAQTGRDSSIVEISRERFGSKEEFLEERRQKNIKTTTFG